jgi:hypothetical protein
MLQPTLGELGMLEQARRVTESSEVAEADP